MSLYEITPNDDTVTAEVGSHVIDALGDRHPLLTVLQYRADDPYAVTMTFIAPQRPADPGVRWTMARDLLSNARTEPAGVGDIHAWPSIGADDRPAVAFLLCSPEGEALVELPTVAVDRFCREAFGLVPAGQESDRLDFDGFFSALLDDAADPAAQKAHTGHPGQSGSVRRRGQQ